MGEKQSKKDFKNNREVVQTMSKNVAERVVEEIGEKIDKKSGRKN